MTSPAAGVAASLRELIALRECAAGGMRQAPRPAPDSRAPVAHARSRGMEFAEARAYQHGDDMRSIDWRQSARRGRLYTKLYQEEHARALQLFVDLGPGMRFGTRVAFKSVLAARAAAWLSWMALAAGERVGGMLWNGAVHQDMPAQGREQHVLDLLRRIADATASAPADTALSLHAPLRAMARTLRPGSLPVLVSDFTTLDDAAAHEIAVLGRRAELVLVHVYDRFEADAPPGRYRVTDGRQHLTLDVRAVCGAAFAERRDALQALARRARATLLPLPTDCALEATLRRAFPSLSRRERS